MNRVKAVEIKGITSEICAFCNTAICDEVHLGEKFRIKNLIVHYFCVLLSFETPQKGDDCDGLRGFLYQDILDELNKSKNRSCEYCGDPGASTHCNHCEIYFHLPCGIIKNAMSQFCNKFPSFCSAHRPQQNIPSHIINEAKLAPPTCIVCLETIDIFDPFNSLWAPCCKKNWYHRICIQQLALTQASLFKCSFCSDIAKFKSSMLKYGIFVPQRDAAWELEQHAFQDLHQRYHRCDAPTCLCPYGRTKSRSKSHWRMLICSVCGSKGTHLRCASTTLLRDWQCQECIQIYRFENTLSSSSG